MRLASLILLSFVVIAPAGCGSGKGTVPHACAIPFEAGPCNAAFPVFAFVDGACVPRTYGGCQGNENRFDTLADCQLTCEAKLPAQCPQGQVPRVICLGCGPAGGCSEIVGACAIPCNDDSPCRQAGAPRACWDGVCQVGGCE
jgi:hypothetical protein